MRPHLPPERLHSRLLFIPGTGCLLWTGSLDGGYGRMRVEGERRYVHRVAWELVNGPVPDGLELDHLCRNRPCANPDHLELVTRKENVHRGESAMAANAAKTHCQNGHEFTPENTKWNQKDQRNCRICIRALDRARYARRKREAS